MSEIKIEHLTKDFGHGRGIFDINIDITKGECFGYLGPNGAGKSTTIRLLMGFTKAQQGSCQIQGIDTAKNRELAMKRVSYIPGELALPRELTGKEVLSIQKELKGVTDNTMLDFLVDQFKLSTDLKCKEMSLGMRRKLVIVSAFMNDPDVIIMDEPSSGLDPEMQETFIQLVKAEKKRGKTILLSSHIFREVDVSCDRIAIIKDGHIVSFFNANDLKHKSLKTYDVTFAYAETYQTWLSRRSDIYTIVEEDEEKKRIKVKVDDRNINEFTLLLMKENIYDFKEEKETLENYFMSFYKEEKTFAGM